jgi:L-iditol 2-dehydrogenase
VQIAVRATTLCGSDLHYYNHFRNGDIVCREPLTLGHESAGEVVAVGPGITKFRVGEKVALEVGLPCGICELCRGRRYNICPEMKFRSSAKSFPHAQGTLQERLNHPAAFVHKLPSELSVEMGALLEPLSVAIHAWRRSNLRDGSTVLVFGAGAVGLLTAAVVRMQVSDVKIVIADVDAGRVNFAVRNGFAHRGYTVPKFRSDAIAEQLSNAQKTAGEISRIELEERELGLVDAVFECTGVPSCLQTAIYATKPGGKVMLIGMGTPVQTLPISAAALREVDILGVFRYANTYPTGMELLLRAQKLLESGQDVPRFDKLITHRYEGFQEIENAFRMAGRTVDDNAGLVLKVLVSLKDDKEQQAKL